MSSSRKGTSKKPTFKVVIAGDAETGKSALLQRLINDKFSKSYIPTIGTGLGAKEYDKAKMHIWATAGQERFKAITRSYYRDTHAFILAYDISNIDSFANITTWIELVKKEVDFPLFYFVGTKCDLDAERVINPKEVKLAALEHGIPAKNCVEVSAKDNIGIDELFNKVANDLTPKPQAKIIIAAENKIADKQHSPSFLQKHRGKIIGGFIGTALALLIASFAFSFWPVIIGLSFIGAAAGAIGVSTGLFAGISIGGIAALTTAISVGSGFIDDAITAAIKSSKNNSDNVSSAANDNQLSNSSPRNGSTSMAGDMLGFDLAATTAVSGGAFLLGNSQDNRHQSPKVSLRQEMTGDKDNSQTFTR